MSDLPFIIGGLAFASIPAICLLLYEERQRNKLRQNRPGLNNELSSAIQDVEAERTQFMIAHDNTDAEIFEIRIIQHVMWWLRLNEGEIAYITSVNGNETVARVKLDKNWINRRVKISSTFLNNLEYKTGEVVELRKAELKNAERVYFCQIDGQKFGEIYRRMIDSSLSLFFENHPIHQGDTFSVPILLSPPIIVRFQIRDIQPSPASIFTTETVVLHWEEDVNEIEAE
ncbi:unnamed protein product [Caenorhabditis angaria]|uniref:Uncharacterized protein n=1 Tax=Caenorhabditis angaria TaxID=860376 RepID=A0A9P1IA09_9PELO|nr:unnamed protein product [Caenorhabditis angaria]